jgi:hypothetical protein
MPIENAYFEQTPRWKWALIRMFGTRIIDSRGRYVCHVYRGKTYLRVARS